MKIILSILFLFLIHGLQAQNVLVRGTVQDTSGNALPVASVILLSPNDSVLQEFGNTNDNGYFKVDAKKEADYLMQITFLGMETHWQYIRTGKEHLDLGIITLRVMESNLPTINVIGEYDPMKIGRDTVEYNAKAFKVQPGAAVEDLLKKLPGIEVQRDGSVKAYGENVQNVLVDGKEFFGKDTRIATKNLEADAVDKVQVFDKKSDMAEFTGVDDGQEEKSINLKLKANRKNGHFGNAELAGGTNERFKTKFNLNRFSPSTRLSLIGLGNNINEQSFSFQDYMEFMGGIGSIMGGSGGRMRITMDGGMGGGGLPVGMGNVQGIQRSAAGGMNITKSLGSKTEVTGSYLLNNMRNILNRSSDKQSLLTDRTYTTNENEDRISGNTSNALTYRLKTKIDSFQNLILRGGAGWNTNQYNSSLFNKTLDAAMALANSSNRDYDASGNSFNFNSTLTWQRRFRKSGRSFILTTSGRTGNADRDGLLNAINTYNLFNSYTDTVLQNQVYLDKNFQWDGRVAYTEPLGNKKFIEWNAYASNSRNKTNTDFYDIILPGVEERNILLSTAYNRGYQVKSTGLRLIKNREKYHVSFGINLQTSTLNGTIQSSENPIKVNYTRLLPELDWNYDFKAGNHLSMNYNTYIQEPALQQLQPTVNNADPLNIYLGNPNLKPEYAHRVSTSYFLYDQFSFTSLFANIGGMYTANRITDLIEIDSLFRRIIKPVNVKNEKNISGNIEFGTPIRPLKIATKLRLRSQASQGILFINSQENKVNRFGNSILFSIENRKKQKVDALLGIKLSGSTTHYSKQPSLDQKYSETNVFGEFTYTPTDKWAFHTEYDGISYNQSGSVEPINVPLWKAHITTYFMKDQRLKATLSVFDILNKNKGITRTSQLNYLDIQRTNVLGRYFMLGFAYSIKGFKKSTGGIEINIGGQDKR